MPTIALTATEAIKVLRNTRRIFILRDAKSRAIYCQVGKVAESYERDIVRFEEISRDRLYMFGCNGIEFGEGFFDRYLPTVDHFALGQRTGTRGGIFEAEQDRGSGLVFHQIEFIGGDAIAHERSHFFNNDVENLSDLFGRRRCRHGKKAAVVIHSRRGADAVSEAAFFANLLPQPARRSAAECIRKQVGRISSFVAGIDKCGRDNHMRLFGVAR